MSEWLDFLSRIITIVFLVLMGGFVAASLTMLIVSAADEE